MPGSDSVDVVVIGAGMAGASAAAALAEHCRVVVLETEKSAGYHSTGRSAASYLPSYGGRVVRQLTTESRELYDDISRLTGVDILRPRPLVWLANDTAASSQVTTMLASQPQLEKLDAADAMSMCSALLADTIQVAALDAAAMDIDVAALHHHYLAELRRRGGSVQLTCPVRAIDRLADGWRVRTEVGAYECGVVVNAAGAWADEVAGLAGVPKIGLQAKRRSVIQTPVRQFDVAADWPLVIDGAERWYFKPEHPNLLVSPADETDVLPSDARPDELEIARAIEDVNAVTRFGLRSVTHAWAGLRSFVSDRAPVVGAWSELPGFHFMAGQGGYGIQMAPALAQVTAEIVLEGKVSTGEVTAEELAPIRLQQLRE